MAYQRDYILRIIEEFFRFLQQILKLKAEKLYDQALDEIDGAAKSFVKVDLKELVTNETKLNEILENKTVNMEQLDMLANLLKVKAEIFDETNFRFSAITHYQLSLGLFEHIQNNSKSFSVDRDSKIKELRQLLNQLDL